MRKMADLCTDLHLKGLFDHSMGNYESLPIR